MATRSQVLTLPADPEEAAAICLAALEELGWEPEQEDGRITATEPADGLCCAIWPVRVEISVQPEGPGSTTARLDFSLPGRGVIQSRQLRDRMRSVGLGIVRVIDAPGRGG